MAIFLIIIVGGWGAYEALKHYDAEKYAQKKVYNNDIDFLSFMLSNHPLSLVWIVLAVIFFVILTFS